MSKTSSDPVGPDDRGRFAVLMAPGVFAMNRGKTLRNIALWLAIFAGSD